MTSSTKKSISAQNVNTLEASMDLKDVIHVTGQYMERISNQILLRVNISDLEERRMNETLR